MSRLTRRSSDLPDLHATFLASSLERLQADSRIAGVAAGGSFLTEWMDEFSDLDLVIAVEPAAFDAVLAERRQIAHDLGPMLSAFTGEHVGEPRLLVCTYGPPLLHVDLKFVSLPDLAVRVEDPLVLWERDGRMSEALQSGEAAYPQPNLQWIEDRFWPWVRYTASKIGRGELFESIECLSFLRTQVLGPLALMECGHRPAGVRRIEMLVPDHAEAMRSTLPSYGAHSCAEALLAAANLYQRLRTRLAPPELEIRTRTEEAVLEYLAEIAGRHRPPRGF